jgi:hypothetical protein
LKGDYKLIVMSFDGDYQTESLEFENVDDAWDYADGLGSRWYFYPFHFVLDQAGEVVAAPRLMSHLEGLTVENLVSHFRQVSKTPAARGVDAERFVFMV